MAGTHKHSNAGFSLVELMIGMLLGCNAPGGRRIDLSGIQTIIYRSRAGGHAIG